MNVSKMKKGFTLLELVVVIVVIGILATIAIPSYSAVIGRANESSARTTAQAIVAEAKILNAFDNAGTNQATAVTVVEAASEVAGALYTDIPTAPTTLAETVFTSDAKKKVEVTATTVKVTVGDKSVTLTY